MFRAKLPEIPGQRRISDLQVPTKVVRCGNYVYPTLLQATGDEDCYKETMQLTLEGIRDTYLNRCYCCEVPDKVFEPKRMDDLAKIESIRRSISRAVNRLSRIREFGKEHPIEFHMNSDRHAAHITLVDDRDEGTGIIAHMYIADDDLELIMAGIININPDGSRFGMGDGALVMYAGMTIFFMSKKYKCAEKAAEHHRDVCKFGIMGSYELYLLEYMLYKLIDEMKSSNETVDHPYLPIEMFMFSTILKDMGIVMEAHTVFTWCHEEDKDKDFLPEDMSGAPQQVFPSFDRPYPQVDFDTKEWKFIGNYCKRNGILCEGTPINLIPYFTNPRYGDTYVMNVNTESGEKDPLVITFKMDPEMKMLRIYISETINEFTSIICLADFINIDNYAPEDGLRKVRKCVMYTNFDHMFPSVIDLVGASPLLQSSIDNTSALITEVLKLFIIMHDRPERSRMVKGVKHTEVPNPNKKKQSKPKETTEVVWRILKPVKAAKEYVRSMSIGAPRNMEYTLEEWDRIGHYRTLKSGKVIWIEPTTCRRRDDLLTKDKDIKIKL